MIFRLEDHKRHLKNEKEHAQLLLDKIQSEAI